MALSARRGLHAGHSVRADNGVRSSVSRLGVGSTADVRLGSKTAIGAEAALSVPPTEVWLARHHCLVSFKRTDLLIGAIDARYCSVSLGKKCFAFSKRVIDVRNRAITAYSRETTAYRRAIDAVKRAIDG
jgi:hypothetical protein